MGDFLELHRGLPCTTHRIRQPRLSGTLNLTPMHFQRCFVDDPGKQSRSAASGCRLLECCAVGRLHKPVHSNPCPGLYETGPVSPVVLVNSTLCPFIHEPTQNCQTFRGRYHEETLKLTYVCCATLLQQLFLTGFTTVDLPSSWFITLINVTRKVACV
ncbi:hypothetical protein CRM22_007477 [Opisthorchis felineus]|uniref:Uncharacterized protein n=1 Tax=Opisthorchis felineus TaxID=147828 RepID=A0A4V3SDY1_OPIFE|nr:hypothetical protein CRM22_007477 [Opisthorchis felineus]